MKGIDFYRRLHSSVHPNLPSILPFASLSTLFSTRVELLAFWPFFLYSCDCKITPCVRIMKPKHFVLPWAEHLENSCFCVGNRLSKCKKTDRCLHAFLFRFVSNWLFIWVPDPLKSNYDHFRLPDGIPIYITDVAYCSVKGDQFFCTLVLRAPWYHIRSTLWSMWNVLGHVNRCGVCHCGFLWWVVIFKQT
jgi:hypothetical protein